jgi:hypothetical protein
MAVQDMLTFGSFLPQRLVRNNLKVIVTELRQQDLNESEHVLGIGPHAGRVEILQTWVALQAQLRQYKFDDHTCCSPWLMVAVVRKGVLYGTEVAIKRYQDESNRPMPAALENEVGTLLAGLLCCTLCSSLHPARLKRVHYTWRLQTA